MNIPKKIHFLTYGDLPYDQRMQRIWSSLHKAGFEISIFGRALVELEADKYPYHIKRYKPLFKTGFLAYAEYNIRSFYFIMSRPVKTLCCVDLDTMFAGIVAKKFSGYKLVYDAHEYYTESPEITNRPFVKKFWEYIGKISIPASDICYTVSSSIAYEMTERYNIPFRLVRNLPVQSKTDKTINIPPASVKYIIYQGALNVGRGLENLILAMKYFPALELWLAGEGDLKETLKDLAKKNDLSGQVRFLGNILPSQLNDLTTGAWLGINLLENLGKSYYLSLANKFFDYIHSGIPQICIDFPEYRLLNRTYHIALLVPDIEINTIRSAIDQLQWDEEMYRRLKFNTFIAAQDLNWEQEEKTLIDIYTSITA